MGMVRDRSPMIRIVTGTANTKDHMKKSGQMKKTGLMNSAE